VQNTHPIRVYVGDHVLHELTAGFESIYEEFVASATRIRDVLSDLRYHSLVTDFYARQNRVRNFISPRSGNSKRTQEHEEFCFIRVVQLQFQFRFVSFRFVLDLGIVI
jgi:hypothetical protein